MKKLFFLILFHLLLITGIGAQTKKVIIDADTANGLDDVFAIARVLRSDKFELLGITAAQWKNQESYDLNTADLSWELNNTILNLMNKREIPSLHGSEMIVGQSWGGDEPRESEATEFIIKKAMEMRDNEKLTIICLGALTNISSAITLKPEIADKISLYILGAMYHLDKNAWDKNEYNVRNDLNAFDVILNNKALEMVIMPANIGEKLIFKKKTTISQLSGKKGIGELIIKLWDRKDNEREERMIWDLALIEAIINPEMAEQRIVSGPPENVQRKLTIYTQIDEKRMQEDFWNIF
ncbi:nucleoside hydrolase [Bacteroidota bacterium]